MKRADFRIIMLDDKIIEIEVYGYNWDDLWQAAINHAISIAAIPFMKSISIV